MATVTAQGTIPALIQPQKDIHDFLREYGDTCMTVLTAIPSDGNLTKEEFSRRHETLTREFRDRLKDVANKESKLGTLVSFVNTMDKAGLESETCSEEEADSEIAEDEDFHQYPVSKEAEMVTESIIYSETSPTDPNMSQNMDGKNEIAQDVAAENEYNYCNLQTFREDTEWLNVPFLAVQRNNFEIVDLCIKTGIDLEKFRDLKGLTLLGYAVAKTELNHDIINVLLECIGVNISAKDGETALITCIQNKGISVKEKGIVLKRLIDAGADVMTRSFYHGTALHGFISSLTTEMDVSKMTEWKSVIDLLLARVIDINAVDFYGQSALMVAITNMPPTGLEDSDVFDSKARKNIIDVRRCKKEIVEYLLYKGADPEVTDSSGRTSLYMALENQNIDVIDTLVKHGANVNHQTRIKMSPAYFICCQDDWSEEEDIENILLPSLSILLDGGSNFNIKGLDDSTPLHYAAAKLNHTVCEFLVKSGADTEARDYLHRSPLHMAVRNPNIRVTETLIKLRADIEAKDIHGDTPLTHACLHGNANAVQILVACGADYRVHGDLGIQPIHIAAENGDAIMMEVLQNMGCDLSVQDVSGSTPLHYAASDGNPITVEYLLNQKVNTKCEDSQGQVPLDLALLRGQYRVSTLLADSKSAVKFGKLPPGLFPNRPLRKLHELDDYLEEIIEPLRTIGEPGAGIGKAILDTPGLGRLWLDEGESKYIFDSIHQLCLEIVERIGELDPLFECKLMNAGSSFEGVKVGYPDEFDFVCHIEKISAFIEKVEPIETPEYSKIVMKDSLPPDISRFCLRSNKDLNAGAILRHFYRLVRIASYDVLKRPHQNIYAGFHLLTESALLFGESPIPLKKLQSFTVSWRGPTYKHIDVSVDLNPVLYTTEWPSKAVQSCILLPNIQEEGMYLIPKFCDIIFALPVETVTVNSDLWRYSTHHVEAAMMQRLPKEARDTYMLCKSFRMEPLTCSVQVDKSEGWMSEASLQKLLPLEEKRIWIPFGDDDNSGDYNEDRSDCDGDEIEEVEERNEAVNETGGESDSNDIAKSEEREDLDRCEDDCGISNVYDGCEDDCGINTVYDGCEHDCGISSVYDGSIQIDKYSDTNQIVIEYDYADDVDEETAEKSIPSYHLKSLFLQEAEAILAKSGTFSDRELQTIPYKVYDRLKTAVETEFLTTLFFPGQNIYRQPEHDNNLSASIKLRLSYIINILRLLRELGFGFED